MRVLVAEDLGKVQLRSRCLTYFSWRRRRGIGQVGGGRQLGQVGRGVRPDDEVLGSRILGPLVITGQGTGRQFHVPHRQGRGGKTVAVIGVAGQSQADPVHE